MIVLLVGCAYGQYGQQARPGYGHSQCVVDNIQKYGDVCIPTLHTVSMHAVYTCSVIFTLFTSIQDCEKESTRNGIQIETDEECYKVVKTICKEDSEVKQLTSSQDELWFIAIGCQQ